jgi:hypothetical protein
MMPTAHRLFLVALACVPLTLALRVSAGAEQKPAPQVTGEAIFAAKCASCHGSKGVGGPGFPKPLVGNRSVGDLGKFIAQSMPPGPNKTPLAEAQKIAAYMHAAFYSPLAQARNRPPRVEMARLTVRQFKNAVADLVNGTAPVIPDVKERGLTAHYFKSRDFDPKEKVLDRVDPEVKFDFGTDVPVPGKFDPHNFSINWVGSILAPDTGDYEFIVRTDHGTKLFVNDNEKPLIDAWVKSGNDIEYHGTVTLLGGRAYPIRLEFSKATQGVNDDEQKKGKPAPKAFVELLWRRPKRVPEVIPSRLLFPKEIAPTFVVSTPFPADDRSIGYERGNTVTKEWEDAVTAAALDAAAFLAKRIPQDKAKLKEQAAWFVQRAFRRGLDKETQTLYVDKQIDAAATPELGMKRVVLLTLLSPRFLYRDIGPGDPYVTAANLSFGLWDTVPDLTLQKTVWEGKLKTPADIEAQATRMANDPRAWNKLRDFLLLWLKVDEIPDIVKSSKGYPDFNPAVAADLRTSLELFLEDAGWDYQKLMLSQKEFLNGRLAKLYGGNLAADASFQPVESADRCGVLTQPYVMARFAYLEGSSPIHRGVLVARNMLGRVLAPPPAAFAPVAASLHPNLTTRERVAMQTKPEMCNSCHGLINPLGFTFEKYDAIGRVRTTDGTKPVDASGYYKTRSGQLVNFKDAEDLAKYLANSDEAQTAFVEKLFQNLVKQPVRAYGPRTLPNLVASFKKDRYNVRSLMVSIMLATASSETKANPVTK